MFANDILVVKKQLIDILVISAAILLMNLNSGSISINLVYNFISTSDALSELLPINTISEYSNPFIISPCAINSGL